MTTQFSTPILFLIFNREDTTQQVFDQIKKIKPKFLFVAADGPRMDVQGELYKCESARKVTDQVNWECEIKTLFRDTNLGCGPAVSSAITWFFNQVEEGIILEDDCVPDQSFFPFCEELLCKYRDVHKVKLISGSNLSNNPTSTDSYYFTKYANIWGWASWKRVWNQYDFKMEDAELTLKNNQLDHLFHSTGEKHYWHDEFLKIKKLKVNTWDYQLLFSIWKQNGISISPSVNLIKNIGFDNNSTRTFLYDSKKMPSAQSISFPLKHSDEIKIQRNTDKKIFNNVYNHSPVRLFRLLRENNILVLLKYISDKILTR